MYIKYLVLTHPPPKKKKKMRKKKKGEKYPSVNLEALAVGLLREECSGSALANAIVESEFSASSAPSIQSH